MTLPNRWGDELHAVDEETTSQRPVLRFTPSWELNLGLSGCQPRETKPPLARFPPGRGMPFAHSTQRALFSQLVSGQEAGHVSCLWNGEAGRGRQEPGPEVKLAHPDRQGLGGGR